MDQTREAFASSTAVRVSVHRADTSTAYVRLTGEVDLAAEIPLADAVHQLDAGAPTIVVVDLADVTFADAALVNFLVRIHNRAADGVRQLLLCRPTAPTRLVLEASSTDRFTTLREELPRRWRGGSRSGQPALFTRGVGW